MVRRTFVEILALLVCLSATPGSSQTQPANPGPGSQTQVDQYFSGVITELEQNSITVKRTVMGTESTTKTFSVTPETRIEGKPKVRSRVTVRFVTADDGGERAVQILVRTSAKK